MNIKFGSKQDSSKIGDISETSRVNHNLQNSQAVETIDHLGALSEAIFALTMVLGVVGFKLPDTSVLAIDSEVSNFIVEQVDYLVGYFIGFSVVAMYWIEHRERFSHYKRSDTIHSCLHLLYLMSIIMIPYSNALVTYFLVNITAQIWFSVNIFFKGLLSLIEWRYATSRHRLVDSNLDRATINLNKKITLIEPIFSIIALIISFINPSIWPFAWLLIPIPYILIEKYSRSTTDL